MNPARTVSISINRDAADVYAYLSDPANFPRWSLFITSMERDGDEWIATTTDGTVRIRFVQPNHFGVVDHWVQVSPQVEVYVPLRVVRNGEGSEVMFSVFRLPGMSDEQFERDLAMVTTDLGRLKGALEAT
jgi:hypothetical protein